MAHEAAEDFENDLATNQSSESSDPEVDSAGDDDDGGASPLPELIQKDAISPTPRYINVLILGETGTGKSTFINAIANYYSYESFEDAEKKQLLVPIPATITLWDKNGKKHTFSVGTPNANESQATGAAATQNVQTYLFPTEDGVVLRLIDTPGMGDPRGVDTDDQNCENILSYLSGHETLHAICFLVKSNHSRITVLFEYCFKQILSRLDISASNNIVFMFTNTKGDYYSGGNTYSCLEEIVNEIMKNQPQVRINFDRNLFYVDNEAFRFLAALQNGVEITGVMRQSAVVSWDQSASECKRLISYVKGDASNPPLPPHVLKDSISINEARRLIDNISKPLADISDNVQDNIRVLKNHEESLKMENKSLESMKKSLYIPVVNLKIVELQHPVTTCMSSKCLEYFQIEDKKLTHYKQRCHEPCGLKGVPALNIGHPSLRGCAAMSSENCRICGCHFTSHMHVYQQTTKYDDKIKDKGMAQNIKNKEEALEARKVLIKDLQNRRAALESEQEEIVEATAMFAHFVQQSAITPFNDCYKSYIQYLITRERTRGTRADQEVLFHLNDMLNRYDAKKRHFDDTLQRGHKTGNYDSVTAESVINRIKTLCGLEFSGEKLKAMMDLTGRCKLGEHKRSWIGVVKEKGEKEELMNESGKGKAQEERRSWKNSAFDAVKSGYNRITGRENKEEERPKS